MALRVVFAEDNYLVRQGVTSSLTEVEDIDVVAGLGYLLKERLTDLDELVRALRDVARGGLVLDPVVVETLVDRRREHGPLLGLTDREREVLHEMAAGRNNATIAKTLFMSD